MSTTQEPLTAEAQDEATEPEKEKASSTREYIVLEQRAKDGPWTEIGRVFSSDTEGALNSLGDNINQAASYVAVAERYWRPVAPKIETQTTITWQ